MDKSYRGRVRPKARAGDAVLPFFHTFVFMPKFAYVVTICNFEFCYKRRAIRSGLASPDYPTNRTFPVGCYTSWNDK